ncbi:MAG: hypothetical protein R2911_15310 [Caldilineaceae bacterium]
MNNRKSTEGTHSYQDPLIVYASRPIHNEAQYDVAVAQMNELIDQEDLTESEHDLLTLIGTLIMAYEDKHYPDDQFELR